ncbi:hypothetical protein [Phyllobacterium leguminum]|uniref:BNR repeat protein n=1 Tax=Phyllobacterium leguminum TaxID=314237 RepID=A0A318T0A0_9HYPH|nr:hypothetical protein [Phyllobacterium leguminum]PYE87061.1 hypothetical protein C7477_11619 [Phyllobacterium leguminum]
MSDNLKSTLAVSPSVIDDTMVWFPPKNLIATPTNPATSAAAPALTEFQNKVWCMHRGGGADTSLRDWTLPADNAGLNADWTSIGTVPGGQQSVAGPALAAMNNQLYCAYLGTDAHIWVTYSSNGIDWSNAQPIISRAGFAPALTFFNGSLWCMAAVSNRLVLMSSSNGQNWYSVNMGGNYYTSKAPALAVFNNQLWCVFRGQNDKGLYAITSTNGTSWNGPTAMGHYSDCEPALVNIKSTSVTPNVNVLFCVYGDSEGSTTLWYTYTEESPNKWIPRKELKSDLPSLPILRAPGTGVGLSSSTNITCCVYRAATTS